MILDDTVDRVCVKTAQPTPLGAKRRKPKILGLHSLVASFSRTFSDRGYYPDPEREKKRLLGFDFDNFAAVVVTALQANPMRELFGAAL